MVVQNIEAVNRELVGFSAQTESGSMNISGEYKLKLKNKGMVPSLTIRLNIAKLSLNTDDILIQETSKRVGRLKSGEEKTVSYSFDVDLDVTSELEAIARSGCNGNKISVSSNESIVGRIFIKEISLTGGIDVSSGECDISTTISPEPPEQPPDVGVPEEPDEPTPEPPEDPEPPDDNGGDNGDGGNDSDNGDSGNGVPESQELTIDGPVSSKVGQTHTYQVEEIPDGTETLQWNSSASQEQISPDNQYSVTFDTVSNQTVGVRAIDQNNNQLGLGQIEVIVVGDNQDQARESNSNIDGLRFISTGQQADYTWADFPDNATTFGWQVLSETENTDATLEQGSLNAGSITLNFQSNTAANYLIVIAASANGEVIEQVQKQITVLPTPE